MMQRDENGFPLPNTAQPMIPGHPGPGDAMVPFQSNGMPPSLGFPGGPTSHAPNVINGGMDHSGLYHSLRRRWILALGMGLVVGAAAAGIVWLLFPTSSSAVALFHVASNQPNLVFDNLNFNNTGKYETYQKTQLALLKSNFVLMAALRSLPANLNTFSGLGTLDRKIQWLHNELNVQFPGGSEILQISLSGDVDNADEVRRIVDAVAKAYLGEVVNKERTQRLRTKDVLATNFAKMQEGINKKLQVKQDLAMELGTADAFERDRESDLLTQEIGLLMRQKADAEKSLGSSDVEFMIQKQRLEDPNMIEMQIDAILAADPTMAAYADQLTGIEYNLSAVRATARGGSSRQVQQLEGQRNDIMRQKNDYRSQAKRQMLAAQQQAPNYELQQATKEHQMRNLMMRSRIFSLDKVITEKKETLQSKSQKSVELQIKNAELGQLSQIRDDMWLKLEGWEVEMEAPDRILPVQDAVSSPGIDSYMRYALAGIGGLAGLALTCFAVAYLEFRNRRLNGPEQVDEGLGIRVVGTLPLLSSRAALDPTHPILAQLTDSIDNVRTLLMHDSTSKARQVVLVTSAASGEGRTTVASQLAASLARAGRRTLLVDGDLRRPALHDLFEVPLEDGLSEVLRAEIDVADIIRPTHAEGLWLMTAGYCDVDAIHALATDQLQPIFEKLRGQYDFIIVDSSPVLGMSDALLVGQYCDGAILSVLRDHSQVPKIYQAAELLRGVGIRVFGSVVNGMNGKSDHRVVQLRLMPPKSERAELQAT
jgi:capsular exopolysaccharide synthesis family protein